MKQSRKIVDERQMNILGLVRNKGEIKVDDIAEIYNISAMTVRRDLKYLEDKKLLKRTHGGAVSLDRAISHSTTDEHITRCRMAISKYAASLLCDGDRIFINASRTALDMLKYVSGGIHVSVFTNNGWAIGEKYPNGVSIRFTGGDMRGHVMVGDYVMKSLLEIKADKTFIGCAAVYDNGEFRYDIPTEIGINESMISRTTQAFYVLADHTKFNPSADRTNLYGSSIFDRPCTLITDDMADETILNHLRDFGIKIITVPVS